MGDDLNQNVRDWADAKRGQIVYDRDKNGKKTGQGLCWDLAEQALANSGAKTSRDLGIVTPDANYVWGDPIDVNQVIPGDILQFRDHKVVTKTVTKITFADGSAITEREERTAIRGPQHTAIVNSRMAGDGSVEIFEQHVRPKPGVQINRVYPSTADPTQPKSTTVSRIHPKTKKRESAEATTTVSISVEGQVWAYRPKKR